MKTKRILLLYKRTVYSVYKKKKVLSAQLDSELLCRQLQRMQHAHDEHTDTLACIRRVIRERNLQVDEYFRGDDIPFDNYDFIISVGGDGTFLKAAAGAAHQLIIGVNSAPSTSVGRLCVAHKDNFAQIIDCLMEGQFSTLKLHRLALTLAGGDTYHVMNDVLLAHENPAVISRYLIKVGRVTEEQRSSGIWVATAIGSTGAIGSAGARSLAPTATDIQYLPRELYPVFGRVYRLRGGVLNSRQQMTIHSLMPKGKLFIDGGNQTIALPYGRSCQIRKSQHPIRTLKL